MNPGEVWLTFDQRLGASWEDLATTLNVSSHELRRFKPGHEAQNLREWLGTRGRIGDLPTALEAIGRVDLKAVVERALADQPPIAEDQRDEAHHAYLSGSQRATIEADAAQRQSSGASQQARRPDSHNGSDSVELTLDAADEVPRRAVATYARLWQLETWLRQMVYVELRAKFGNNWQQQIAAVPGSTLARDLRLTHMPSPEQSPISYITFGMLLKTIDNDWALLDGYLPPQDLWRAKLEEVTQIRNRIAHFRRGHADDLDRVLRLMRDIDQGFWRFCTTYNDAHPVLPPGKDPVVKQFHHLNQFPFAKVGTNKWAMAGVADPEALYNLTVGVSRRPWRTNRGVGRIAGEEGYLYDVTIMGRDRRVSDYRRFLHDTESLHVNLVHVCLDAFADSVRITIPAVLGTRVLNKTIQDVLDWVPNSLHRSSDRRDRTEEIQHLADEWPEYVLEPRNPLCFVTPDMQVRFFMA